MADIEIPEADAVEQEPDAGAAPDPDLGVETPEADALEQARAVGEAPRRALQSIRDGVPEADAWEQSQPYGDDLDDERG